MPNETTAEDRDVHDTPTENFSILLHRAIATTGDTQPAIPLIGIRGEGHIAGTAATSACPGRPNRAASRARAAEQSEQVVAALLEHLDTGRRGGRSWYGATQQGVDLGMRAALSGREHADEAIDLAP